MSFCVHWCRCTQTLKYVRFWPWNYHTMVSKGRRLTLILILKELCHVHIKARSQGWTTGWLRFHCSSVQSVSHLSSILIWPIIECAQAVSWYGGIDWDGCLGNHCLDISLMQCLSNLCYLTYRHHYLMVHNITSVNYYQFVPNCKEWIPITPKHTVEFRDICD